MIHAGAASGPAPLITNTCPQKQIPLLPSPASPAQGRFLNTPELVPFRLTRDLVDGMGLTGVEGVMRRCCEETLRVSGGSASSRSRMLPPNNTGANPAAVAVLVPSPGHAYRLWGGLSHGPATTACPCMLLLSTFHVQPCPACCPNLPPAPPALPAPQVLRASKESILTVIEVFIHDPLYKWALTTTAAARRQTEAGAEEVGTGGPAGWQQSPGWLAGTVLSCRGDPRTANTDPHTGGA
jgi:ataxia telangiectasia mutated family protein